MLAIEFELLTGRYAATSHSDRSRAEWPPHPARIFSALVAAHYEGRDACPRERAALEWLERQPAPAMAVPLDGIAERDVKSVYVPINDVSAIGDLDAGRRDVEAQLNEAHRSGASPKEIKDLHRKLEKAQASCEKAIAALGDDASKRTDSERKSAGALLPEHRSRKARTFPVIVPPSAVFTLVWPQSEPADHLPALRELAARVTRLGHSSSLVRCCVPDAAPRPNLEPRSDGELVLRTVGPGQLARLDHEFDRHVGVEPRTLPARPQRYGKVEAAVPKAVMGQGVFSEREADWIVFERVGGARLLASRGVALARALRAALLEQAGRLHIQLPPCLSAHREGAPASSPHVAFVPLPYVGSSRADASIQGIAVVMPRGASREERILVQTLIAEWEDACGEQGVLTLAGTELPPWRCERVLAATKWSTNRTTWSHPSRLWRSSTPIALDRNPGNLRSNTPAVVRRAEEEVRKAIASACAYQGLPAPERVQFGFTPFVAGAQRADAFAARSKPTGHARVRVHVQLEFEYAVAGPLMLGATRYFGGGLCLPCAAEHDGGDGR